MSKLLNLLKGEIVMSEQTKVPVTDEMVNRFLSQKLPKTFAPDCGISFDRKYWGIDGIQRDREPSDPFWPVGTNLFDANEARQMLEYVLAAAPQPNDEGTSVRTTDEYNEMLTQPTKGGDCHAGHEQSLPGHVVPEGRDSVTNAPTDAATLPLTKEQIHAVVSNWSEIFEQSPMLKSMAGQALLAIELRDELAASKREVKQLLADIERLVNEAYKRDEELARYRSVERELPDEPVNRSQEFRAIELRDWKNYAGGLRTFATAAVARAEKVRAHATIIASTIETIDNRAMAAEIERLKEKLENVASIGRRMSYALKRSDGHDALVNQCVELFKRYDLGGSIIRENDGHE